MNDSYHIEESEIRINNYLSGNCTEEEKETLLAYLASDEDAAKIFREVPVVWAVSSVPAFAKIKDTNLSQIKEQIAAAEMKPVRLRKIVPPWLKVAAATIPLLGCNYSWYTYTESLTEVYVNADSLYEVKVPAGLWTNVVPPDGTEVSLNAGSVLRYCRGFGICERDVTPDGEGCFKVAKNAKIPFFVDTNGVQVKIMRTASNVRAYGDNNCVMVPPLEGRVNLAVSSGSATEPFPSEQVPYDKNTGCTKKMKSNASFTCDWLDGGLISEDASFADIAHRPERKLQVKTSLESERLKVERFSGCFNSNQSINDILGEINVEKQYTWKVSGDTIFITDKRKEVK